MVQTTAIELQTGPGRRYRRCGAVFWFALGGLLLLSAGRVPSLWVLTGTLLWLSELPALRGRDGRVTLHRDGALSEGGEPGSWSPRSWTTNWLTILPVYRPAGRGRLVIARSRNDPEAYRLLRIWLRYPPVCTGGPDAGHVP